MTPGILHRNNIKVFGKGTRPMMFAHGFGCDQRFWRFVAPAFEDEYQIILFDHVGSGKSDRNKYDPERYSSLTGYAQDVIDICKALDLTDVIFVGHSVSSMIGVLASIQEPVVFSRLVVIGASPCYLNIPPDYFGGYERADIGGLLDMLEKNHIGWAGYLAPVAMKNADRPELAIELEESFNATNHAIMCQFAAATFWSDFRGDLPKASAPSLIMQPSEDAFVPLQVAEYLHRQMAGSALALMRATGHFPHLSAPDETIQIMKEYLSTAHGA
ncbi:MAG: alpha/beta hydrolase [Chloroflexales bacterium]